ncbi:MAG: hypothetical protein H6923_05640 [Alphaproteobacteria bacterium]|nr:hypothetical protein [Alphaproteobacteria bacterium]
MRICVALRAARSRRARVLAFLLAALAGPAGSLTAAEIPLAPGADLAAESARLAPGDVLVLAAGTYRGPIVAEGRAIAVRGAGPQTVVETDRSNAVALALSGGDLALSALSLKAGDGQVALYVKEAVARLDRVSSEDARGDAIYVEAGSLSASEVSLLRPAGTGIVALKGASLDLARLTVEDAQKTAVILQEGKSLKLVDSRLSGAGGVAVQAGAPEIVIERTTISSWRAPEATGLYLYDAPRIALVDTAVYGGAQGVAIQLPAGGEAALRGVTVYRPSKGGISIGRAGEDGTAGADLAASRIAVETGQGGYGLLVTGKLSATLRSDRVLARGGPALAVQNGARVESRGGLYLGSERSAQFVEADDRGSAFEKDLLLPPGTLAGAAAIGIGTAELEASLDEAALGEIANALADVLDFPMQAAPPPETSAATALGRLETLLAAHLEGGDPARLTVEVRDMAGRAEGAPFRLLSTRSGGEAAYGGGRPARVDAGTYVVALDGVPAASEELTVEAGEARAVTIEAADALWLHLRDSYAMGAPAKRLLLVLEPLEKRRAILARLRNPAAQRHLAAPRGDASEADRREAVRAARAWLGEGAKANRPPPDSPAILWQRHMQATEMAQRILALYGDASDIASLTEFGEPKAVYFDPYGAGIGAAAAIEARLGKLDGGVLADAARGTDLRRALPAAIRLRAEGIRSYDEAIVRYLESAPMNVDATAEIVPLSYYARVAFEVLWDLDDPRLVAAARKIVAEFVARDEEIAATWKEGDRPWNKHASMVGPAVMYLLGHAGTEDLSVLSRLDLAIRESYPIGELAADPIALAEFFRDEGMLAWFPSLAMHLRRRDRAEALSLVDGIGAIFYRLVLARFEAQGEGWKAPDRAQANYNGLLADFASEFPNAAIAGFYYGGEGQYNADPESFVPKLWEAESYLKILRDERPLDAIALQQLDYIPLDKVEAFLADPASSVLPAPGLMRAWRRTATRGFFDPALFEGLIYYADAVERRPFMLSSPSTESEYRGAISGRFDFEPRLKGSSFELAVGADLAPYYNDRCSLASMIATGCAVEAWANHKYVVNGGRALLADLRLEGPDGTVPLEDAGRTEDGRLLFRAALPKSGVRGATVRASLVYFDQRYDLAVSLTQGEFARRLHGAQADAERARAQIAAAPQDPGPKLALADALLVLGKAAEARAAIDGALAAATTADAWLDASDLLLAHGELSAARETLGAALKRFDRDADIAFAYGAAQYRAGASLSGAEAGAAYALAFDGFRLAEALAGESREIAQWAAHSAFLAGRAGEAAARYGWLAASDGAPQSKLLAMISSGLADPAAVPALSTPDFDAALAELLRLSGEIPPNTDIHGIIADPSRQPNAWSCTEGAYRGWKALVLKEDELARKALAAAKAACATSSLPARLAVAGLAGLPAPAP